MAKKLNKDGAIQRAFKKYDKEMQAKDAKFIRDFGYYDSFVAGFYAGIRHEKDRATRAQNS